MKIKYYSRKCDECNKGMEEGYVWGNGDGYACSDVCLFVHGYTPKDAHRDFENDDIYWTDWEQDWQHDPTLFLANGTEVDNPFYKEIA